MHPDPHDGTAPRPSDAADAAAERMLGYAARTGLVGDRAPTRYLWTDAFAVCNLLALGRRTGEALFAELAIRLVEQVHGVLGRHRTDDPGRRGWLSGLAETEGAQHPTRGGLRIGKRLPERGPGERADERLEWDRDGQYFHYLTRWMHALDRMAWATGDARHAIWARELAEVAVGRFAVGAGRARRLVWKMSTDLSRPLVSSSGQHDPLDGLVTCLELELSAVRLPGAASGPPLDGAIAELAAMIDGGHLATADPLGLGGLLGDAARVAQLMEHGVVRDPGLLIALLEAAAEGVAVYARIGDWRGPVERRLAFRELGLAIGLAAVDRLRAAPAVDEDAEARAALDDLERFRALGQALVATWLEPEAQRAASYAEHLDINEVMLATALVPEGYLAIGPGEA